MGKLTTFIPKVCKIANTFNIHKKINMKSNAILVMPFNLYKQLKENNILCLTPYVNDILNAQNEYVSYRESIPQYVKDMEGCNH